MVVRLNTWARVRPSTLQRSLGPVGLRAFPLITRASLTLTHHNAFPRRDASEVVRAVSRDRKARSNRDDFPSRRRICPQPSEVPEKQEEKKRKRKGGLGEENDPFSRNGAEGQLDPVLIAPAA